jgi:2-oxoglutarate ferredoxin oxidoreductase subunit beta
MSFIKKPQVLHDKLPRNDLGLTIRDYEGGMSTLCAGCGHDSITASIVQAFWELHTPPHRVAKMSGIGCSSKTPAYFLRDSHGINTVHGRMPSVATGANAANRDLTYIGISGDGDSLSIGMGQLVHALRRNLDMLYIIENNGVYGLTKGQFSASADVGTTAKKGAVNLHVPIDPITTGLSLGGSFLARSFSGDKEQLVPLIKAGLSHRGFALLDIISPCVTFNDHVGSTKSYQHTRNHGHRALLADYVPPAEELKAAYDQGKSMRVDLHDGSHIVLRKTARDFDPTNQGDVFKYLLEHKARGEIVTGLLYFDESQPDFHEQNNTDARPLNTLPYDDLCPGSAALESILARYR